MGQITIVHCGVKNKNGIMSRVLRRALSAYGGVQWFDGAAVSCPDQTPRFLLYECTGIPQITSGAGILVFDNGFLRKPAARFPMALFPFWKEKIRRRPRL